MKKLPYIYILIVIVSIVFVFFYNKKSSSRIEITNTGSNVIEIKDNSRGNKIILGQHGTGKFGSDSIIQLGDTIIKVGKNVEVKNTGSNIIQITYNDKEGSEQKLLLGRGGTGYINKSKPFKIGNTYIQVN